MPCHLGECMSGEEPSHSEGCMSSWNTAVRGWHCHRNIRLDGGPALTIVQQLAATVLGEHLEAGRHNDEVQQVLAGTLCWAGPRSTVCPCSWPR